MFLSFNKEGFTVSSHNLRLIDGSVLLQSRPLSINEWINPLDFNEETLFSLSSNLLGISFVNHD